MNTATEAGFITAICAEPADDTPRVIYADWLQERDGPGDGDRGEFIRVQCEMAKIKPYWKGHPGCALEKRYETINYRETELFESMGANPFGWFPGICTVTIDPSKHLKGNGLPPGGLLRRGFIEQVKLPLAAWLEHGKEIVRQQPITQVETEKKPYVYQRTESAGTDYSWWRAYPDKLSASDLPTDIFDLLTDGVLNSCGQPDRGYDTLAAAQADLSQALLQLAKGAKLSEPR